VSVESLVVRREGDWSRSGLERSLAALLSQLPVLRLKGRLHQQGKRLPLQIQAVGPRLECWYEADGATASVQKRPAELELVALVAAADSDRVREALTNLEVA
jgi:cobalamin biosynthesis protein CobW